MGKQKKRSRKTTFATVTIVVVLLAVILLVYFAWYWFSYSGKTWDDLFAPTIGQPDDPSNDKPNDQPDDPSNDKPNDQPDDPSNDKPNVQPDDPSNDKPDDPPTDVIETGELSIRFLELGNGNAGDCTLIKVGDTEVLIDAGSLKGSAATLVPTIREYCTDGVLEYVIATHAHQDHIAAFVGTTTAPGIFQSFECNTIIDYPLTNSTSAISKSYAEMRDEEVKSGATHYTALECWKEENGAKRSYELAEGITLNVLYNYYYENKSSDENNYSVCTLITQGEFNYLFTGDLEEKGEEHLVEYNDLPQCKLFKGGHHGSRTSSTEILLQVIRPEIVCICCCAGSPEYTTNRDNTFPTQEMLDRVAVYTDRIYVTSLATDVDWEKEKWNYTSLNGMITYTSDGKTYTVVGSNHSKILKDTEWFQENRVWNGT